MIIPVHVAQTLPNGTFAALADWPGRFVLEVGASDRNTVDIELLPRWSDAFLVTAEPLLDKVGRALARRVPAHRAFDQYEPLGRHHERGLVLPVAVGPTPAKNEGELQSFHVGRVAGCSSLANVTKAPAHGKFGAWCQKTVEERHVWTLPLKALIGRLPARSRVALLKIDAQGYDLNVVTSAGSEIGRIDYVAMEVVSDDCAALYDGQPKCTQVVETMFKHNFVPLGPVPCTPTFRRARFSHFCELEIVFRNREQAHHNAVPREVYELHQLHFNGCESLYTLEQQRSGQGWREDNLFATGAGMGRRYEDASGRTSSNTSFAKPYACPSACAAPKERGSLAAPSALCPW